MSRSTEELVSALIVLTQKKDIRWKVVIVKCDSLFDGVRVDGPVYKSEVNNKTITLMRYSCTDYSVCFDTVYPDYSFRLVIGDDETELDDNKYALGLLYDVVRDSCHGVDDWFEDVVELAGAAGEASVPF